jgi:hypothetical protein
MCKMLDRSSQRSVSGFGDCVGGGSVDNGGRFELESVTEPDSIL